LLSPQYAGVSELWGVVVVSFSRQKGGAGDCEIEITQPTTPSTNPFKLSTSNPYQNHHGIAISH
jgi:hypothetical protein